MSYETKSVPNNSFLHSNMVEQQITALPTSEDPEAVTSEEDLIEQELMERAIQLGLVRQVESRVQQRMAEIEAQKDETIAEQAKQLQEQAKQLQEQAKQLAERDARDAEKDARIAQLQEIIKKQQAESEVHSVGVHDIINHDLPHSEDSQDVPPIGEESSVAGNNEGLNP